jgi:adenylosuccinate lyase
MNDSRFTDGRVPDSGIKQLFSDEHRLQCFLDVEAALAQAEAAVGLIPQASADKIVATATLKRLDIDRIKTGIHKTSHPLMALVSELGSAVGDPEGGWVHWGATTQNITQTGDVLLLREAHRVFLEWLGRAFAAMADLAEKGQNMVEAGRTHGQHAVPITFGFKVASWIDECDRHVERLREVEPRIFTVMIGGAVGNYASLGERGPIVQDQMAKLLDLQSMPVPSRAMGDCWAEYVCTLGLLAGTIGRIAKEVYLLMETEFGEVSEPIPAGTIGSSTMPHKRNPQLADDCIAISAQIRSLVPFALESMLHDHEVCGANSAMGEDVLRRVCVLMGDLLVRFVTILSGLTLNEKRMKANLEMSGGLISSEAVMLALGEIIGRQHAHEVVYEAAQAVAGGKGTFRELLVADSRVANHVNKKKLDQLLAPESHIGLSAVIAGEAAERAHKRASQLITSVSKR